MRKIKFGNFYETSFLSNGSLEKIKYRSMFLFFSQPPRRILVLKIGGLLIGTWLFNTKKY